MLLLLLVRHDDDDSMQNNKEDSDDDSDDSDDDEWGREALAHCPFFVPGDNEETFLVWAFFLVVVVVRLFVSVLFE